MSSASSPSSLRFRFTQVEESSDEQALLNLCPSSALFDVSNVIACNEEYIAIPWHHSNGVAVFAQGYHGKVDLSSVPLLTAQTGAITNVAFDRFQRNCLCSCHDDGAICVWRIPNDNEKENDLWCERKPEYTLHGHSKRCNVISFHPTANGVCASAGLDGVLNVWDVETGEAGCVINESELFTYPTGVEWNNDGSQLCISSREKQLILLDPRCSFTSTSNCGGGNIISSSSSEGKSFNVIHTHNRQLRCIWPTGHDSSNNIITCSVDEYHRRGLEVWDTRALHSPVSSVCLDQSSAHMIPCYDHDLDLLYLATRGEAGFVCYALQHGSLHLSYEYDGNHLVKGICAAPKCMLNLRANEYNRLFQLTSNSLITLHASLPRRSNDIENDAVNKDNSKENKESEVPFDLYPYTNANKAAMTSEMYFAHTNVQPIRCDLRGLLSNDKKVIIIHEEHEKECSIESMSRVSEAHDSEHEKMERKEEVLEQEQQSTNEVNFVNESSKTKRVKHVDPASNDMMQQQHHHHHEFAESNLVQINDNTSQTNDNNNKDRVDEIKKLISELHNAQSELITMRAALRSKEEEVDRLISALVQLTSST